MDLTSLSSNLPRNSSQDDHTEDEEPSSTILMSAFKQAAQSVTALYKMAGEQVERSRREGQKDGYQDCLDDLFALIERLEGKVDAPTREVFRQWALGKRRKLGPRQTRREEREASSESDSVDRQRSSSPMQSPQHQQTAESLPPVANYTPPALPQLGTFNFQTTHHLPRHVPPPPETSDIELPDNDSPPTSPRIAPQQNVNMFQHTKNFGHQTGSRMGRHSRSHPSKKRRFESVDDFFELAGMEKMRMGKKGRFT
ncbi:hypothetical protein FN846DRAFT_70623 [Sphaerosporella brunnea]|uniref:Uncharacterized protein n=1 Tax=Sphaerosporella brunnea TaxID=1250544 RepID=A0A5J5ETC6_9PEZI|nr:hypothetical protein FN846DRAFT_70623 [Sphaerosporella brunnea]